MKFKKYTVAVELDSPVVYGLFHVEAKNKKEAIEKAKKEKFTSDFDVVSHCFSDWENFDCWEE